MKRYQKSIQFALVLSLFLIPIGVWRSFLPALKSAHESVSQLWDQTSERWVSIWDPTPARHLLMTTAVNIAGADLEIFLRSMRAYHDPSRVDLVVFTGANVDNATVHLFGKYKVTKKTLSDTGRPIVMERFNSYLDLLKEYQKECPGGCYDLVAFSDSRDVAFQGNLFTTTQKSVLPKSSKDYVIFSLEGYPDWKINACRYNSGWVRCFGDDVYERVKDQTISCAGVTIGTFNGMLEYNQIMSETIVRTGCNDQGIHNWLLYEHFPQHPPSFEPITMKNGEGPILTAGYVQEPDFQVDSSSVSLKNNPYPHFIAVVHQFDRYSLLTHHFEQQWKTNNK